MEFEDLAENVLTAENVVYNCIRIQLRGLGVRDHIVNFVARLKGRMSGLRVVTAPRFLGATLGSDYRCAL